MRVRGVVELLHEGRVASRAALLVLLLVTSLATATRAQDAELREPLAQDTEAPVTEAPVTEGPVTEAPVTEAPVTEGPVTEGLALETPVPFEVRWSLARSLLVGGRLVEAEDRLRALTAEEPLRVEPWIDLMRLLIVCDRGLDAYRLASRIDALAPGRADVALIDAAIAMRVGDREGALRRLGVARARDDTDAALLVAERAVRHRMDPVHVLALPRPSAEAWLTTLDEADAMTGTAHLLGVLGALTGVGAIASILVGAGQSLRCAFGGCTSDPGVALAAVGALLGAASVALTIGAAVTHHDARARRARPMSQFESRQGSER